MMKGMQEYGPTVPVCYFHLWSFFIWPGSLLLRHYYIICQIQEVDIKVKFAVILNSIPFQLQKRATISLHACVSSIWRHSIYSLLRWVEDSSDWHLRWDDSEGDGGFGTLEKTIYPSQTWVVHVSYTSHSQSGAARIDRCIADEQIITSYLIRFWLLFMIHVLSSLSAMWKCPIRLFLLVSPNYYSSRKRDQNRIRRCGWKAGVR